MPAEGTAVLENPAFDLAREASELSAQLHPVVQAASSALRHPKQRCRERWSR
jgi:hypothetical protein